MNVADILFFKVGKAVYSARMKSMTRATKQEKELLLEALLSGRHLIAISAFPKGFITDVKD